MPSVDSKTPVSEPTKGFIVRTAISLDRGWQFSPTAGEPPTAVVWEAGTPMPVKLARIGVEDSDAAILVVTSQSALDRDSISSWNKTRHHTAVGLVFDRRLYAANSA